MTMLKYTTADCEKLLPGVLVEYLWQLAAANVADEQTFVLKAKYDEVGDVQDILHRANQFSSWRQVFGYAPVNATVEVRKTQFGYIMSLQGGPAASEYGSYREVSECSA